LLLFLIAISGNTYSLWFWEGMGITMDYYSNMRTFFKTALLIFALSFSDYLIAKSPNFVTDSAPFISVMENKIEPATMTEATNHLLLERLGVMPKITLLPTLRIERFLESEQPTCVFNRIRTSDRANKYIFSYPTDVFLTAKLYQHISDPPIGNEFLDDKGRLLSLARFFNQKNNNDMLLLMSGGSYGAEIDKKIKDIDPSSIVMVTGENPTASYLKIFFKNRADFIIFYPSAMERIFEQTDELRSYTISASEHFISGRIMCNKTAGSHTFIGKVNKALKELYLTDEFINAILDFTPKSDHQFVREIINSELIPETQTIDH
jgi:uncharacterized protein (TIGR02285 family)